MISYVRYRCSDFKNFMLQLQLMFFVDCIMTNTTFFEPIFLIGFVPAGMIRLEHIIEGWGDHLKDQSVNIVFR
jgi:hypothetical protein